ncbi:MAG: T9SS type A sorting domain-containing protein, partial [Bacteroidetes bacterium]|nr:T9SS type A sorting domain-containing protein [Bacteroidota bacterium]
PVELTTFFALITNEGVMLKWVTSTETNNQGFEIQRSKAENEYENIGYVPGHGTTTKIQTYSYTDSKVASGNYTYRLKQIDYDGTIDYLDEIAVEVIAPLEFALEQNYPNPFNPSTVIKYSISTDGYVKLAVYNLLGEEIVTLVNEEKPPGVYEVEFNVAKNSILSSGISAKAGFASGVYFYQLRVGSFVATKKMVLLR